MSEQLVQWVAPAPAWNEAARLNGSALAVFRQPVILRFSSDGFMDELLAVLAADPDALRARRAVPETWRDPAPEPPLPARPPALLAGRFARPRAIAPVTAAPATVLPARPLKLYQPAHGRYYLVATCLVCRLPGLPDRVVDAGDEERVGFVIRRLRPRDGGNVDEYAMVTAGGLAGWRRVGPSGDTAASLLTGEETLPLAPVSYTEDNGRTRRLWTGLIPTGKRETYVGSPELPAPEPADGTDQPAAGTPPPAPNPALLLFQRLVSGPWLALLDAAAAAERSLEPEKPGGPPQGAESLMFLREIRENLQTGSWYILLDFAEFLEQQMGNVWDAVAGQPSAGLSAAETALLARLGAMSISTALAFDLTQPSPPAISSAYDRNDIWGSLRAALAGTAAFAADLETIETAYDRTIAPNPAVHPQWPGFLFPLADPLRIDDATMRANVADLEALVAAALPAQPTGPVPVTPIGAREPLDPRGADRFVIRCVFDRPRCTPVISPLVSLPSEPFLLAGFFDPDAPARPIRIALPVDISPAVLRKFDKGAVFMVSDALCGQINRLKGLSLGDLIRSVLPWPLHKDLSVPAASPCRDGGLCMGLAISISLPIITICALLMLLVIVALLDIIFRWLPYFIFVYPVRLFCAKGNP